MCAQSFCTRQPQMTTVDASHAKQLHRNRKITQAQPKYTHMTHAWSDTTGENMSGCMDWCECERASSTYGKCIHTESEQKHISWYSHNKHACAQWFILLVICFRVIHDFLANTVPINVYYKAMQIITLLVFKPHVFMAMSRRDQPDAESLVLVVVSPYQLVLSSCCFCVDNLRTERIG